MQLTIQNAAVPPGSYRAKYLGSEEITTSFGEALKLEFEVVSGDYSGQKISRLRRPRQAEPILPSCPIGSVHT